MKNADVYILAINAGSSSIRFAVFRRGETLEPVLRGKIGRIGAGTTTLAVDDPSGRLTQSLDLPAFDATSAAALLIDWMEANLAFDTLGAVGHRIVHGMHYTEPQCVTAPVLEELQRISACDPEHMPAALALLEAFRQRHPDLPQVACFDTSFHRDMPRRARLLPIPRRHERNGLQRYGFHGLSYAYLIDELNRLGDPAARSGRVVLAHLGSGASLAAVRDGKSIDTTMGFTPASGIPMGTRSGDLDPGLASYLARTEQMTTAQFDVMVNHESGLLGVSGISPDIRDLLACEATDPAAADAVSLFCYQIKKCIGAYAAALGGLDTLVFAGGIGENAPVVRARICDGLEFLGIAIDPERNAANASLIAYDRGPVAVRVVPTHEELMIARYVCRKLGWRVCNREAESVCAENQAGDAPDAGLPIITPSSPR